jgi:predicted phosphodiesterase
MNKPIYIIGDVHGKWEKMFAAINKNELSNCYLICVGDLGIGFKSSYSKEIRALEIANEFFSKRDIRFLSIRGNHDNPTYFSREILEFTNLRLIPDYHVEFINGEKFLFVGGAISIDRCSRQEGILWWQDETLEFVSDLAVECDVLITHSAPIWLGPFDKDGIIGWGEKDQYLWRDCVKERDDIGKIVELSKPSRLYCGHFHAHYATEQNKCRGRILAELEIIEHRQITFVEGDTAGD